MPDSDKQSTVDQRVNNEREDLVEQQDGEALDTEGVVTAISRGVGSFARTMSDGLGSFAGLFRPPPPRRVKRPAERTEELLAQLGEMVDAHRDDISALRNEEAFWRLVGKLFHVHRRKRVQREPDEPDEPRGRSRAAGRASKKVKAKAKGKPEPDETGRAKEQPSAEAEGDKPDAAAASPPDAEPRTEGDAPKGSDEGAQKKKDKDKDKQKS